MRARRHLILASRNAHKAQELSVLLDPYVVLPLPHGVELPPETGETFVANALGKARAAAAALGVPVVADDSGIVAAALDGRPGVRSARYAGENASDRENLDKLRREAPAGSALTYVCSIAYVAPDADGGMPVEAVFEGRCPGTLDPCPRGDGGFGYDPVFVPDDPPDGTPGGAHGRPRTMAQLSAQEKASISHRGHAARQLLAWLVASGG